MVTAAVLLGLHMAATHGISLAMLASYIPAGELPGLGHVTGTAWALTDLLLGEDGKRMSNYSTCNRTGQAASWTCLSSRSCFGGVACRARTTAQRKMFVAQACGFLCCPDPCAGVVLMASNWLAGWLCDATAARGLGGIGCFLGGATASGLAMAALALFSTFGDLAREGETLCSGSSETSGSQRQARR